MVLNIIPLEIKREGDKYLYTLIHIAALKQITQHWLHVKPPSINTWNSQRDQRKWK